MHRPGNIKTVKDGDGDTLTRSSARTVSFAADVVFERTIVGPEPLTPYRSAPSAPTEIVRINWRVSDMALRIGLVAHTFSTTFLNDDPNCEIEKLVVNSSTNSPHDLEYLIYVKPNISTETRVSLIRLTGGSFSNPMRFLIAANEATKRAALNYILSPQVVSGGNNVHPGYFESEHANTLQSSLTEYSQKPLSTRLTLFYDAKVSKCCSANPEIDADVQNSPARLRII